MFILLFLIFIIVFCVWIVNIPGKIAINRGISGGELQTIKILSWCGLFWGITWFIALGLALVWEPKNWVSKEQAAEDNTSDLEKLEQLHRLYKSKVLSESEYKQLKQELLNKN